MDTSIDKGSCWYQDYCIEEMNRFYDLHIKNHDIKKHFSAFTELLQATQITGTELLDLGCGTGLLSEFCHDFVYRGADLPKIIAGCAMRNYPGYFYKSCDITVDSLHWLKNYPIIVLNGVIDIMEFPLQVLEEILFNCDKYLIIHRQEITEQGLTEVHKNGSYGGYTYHSKISRNDFNSLLQINGFTVVKEIRLEFGNWENGGSSFLLKREK